MSRIRVFTIGLAAVCLTAPAAAYQISHSYSAEANATEFHGVCDSGDRIVIVRDAAGGLAYRGPAGSGRLDAGADIDAAAKAACDE